MRGVRQSLERYPSVADRVGSVRRRRRELGFSARSRLADLTSKDPYLATGRVFYVPLRMLRHRAALPYGYDASRRPGAVVPGDWDQPESAIEDMPYWAEFREALEGRRPWSETQAFRTSMKAPESEARPWRRRIMLADAQREFQGYDLLYESMRRNGFLPQRELARRRPSGYQPINTDDISIAVGRDGELLLCQGGHRVEAARSLGIESVPVWVGVRHSEWWAFRQRILVYAASHGGTVPEQLLHPDLDNIPYSYDCRARFDLVSTALSSSRGLLLDASPGWGHFLHRFEALGFDCTGISTVEEDRYFLERLRTACDTRFAITDEVGPDIMPRNGRVTALLLLRGTSLWMSSASKREALATLLANARPRHVFVESDVPGRSVPAEAGPTASADDIVQFCGTATALPHTELLGYAGESALYHLSELS